MIVKLRETQRVLKLGRPLEVEFADDFFDDATLVVFQIVFRQTRKSKPVIVQTMRGRWDAVFKGNSPITFTTTALGFYTAQLYGLKAEDGGRTTVTYQPVRLIQVVP